MNFTMCYTFLCSPFLQIVVLTIGLSCNQSRASRNSQELFEGVEQERKWMNTPSRNVNTFHHPSVGNFGFQSVSYQLSHS